MATIYHPGLGQTVGYQLALVPDDADGQVAQVIEMMASYVRRDVNSPEIQDDAAQVRLSAAAQGLDLVTAVFRYVKRKLSFIPDEGLAGPFTSLTTPETPVVEVLIPPAVMSRMCPPGSVCRRLGDCDDWSMYTAALLLALGIPAKFVTVAVDGRDPNRFSHVYVAAYVNGDRIPIDTSHGPGPGVEVQNVYRRQEWPVNGMSLPEMLLWLVPLTYLYQKMRRFAV